MNAFKFIFVLYKSSLFQKRFIQYQYLYCADELIDANFCVRMAQDQNQILPVRFTQKPYRTIYFCTICDFGQRAI